MGVFARHGARFCLEWGNGCDDDAVVSCEAVQEDRRAGNSASLHS